MSAIRGIILGTILCLVVLTLATYNILVSMLATINILFVIATFTGCLYLSGYKISMVESVNLSLVAGLAVDYVVHLSESYYQAPHDKRQRRVRDMLEHMGISVLSGSITTAGASAFLLHSHMFFFFQFGLFVLVTIFLSVFYCLFWFTPMLGLVGPEGDVGSLEPAFRWIARTLESLPKTSASSVQQRKISYSRSSSYNVSARAKTSSSGVLRRGV